MTVTIDEVGLRARVIELLGHWPTAGLAVGVVRDGALAWFHGHGFADVASSTPVTEDTVFRIASVTKTMTAVAVMQLWEEGLVDLDAPANEYLRAFRLVPGRASFAPATVRQLLTHTAGVRAVRTPADLVRPTLGWGVPAEAPVPPLSEYYRGALRVDVEPGTKWAYSNHGYAALGQIVEDVSGLPLDRYLRERVFDPLGMDSTDLLRSERVRGRLATGYVLGSHGLEPVTDREIVTAAASSVFSTTRDMAGYVAALLGGGANQHGSVLGPETLARMFQPHYRPDPRLPGMGLAFYRDEVGGHPTVSHDGIWTGFHAAMEVVPDAGVGVVALANTGPFNPIAVTGPVVKALLRVLLGAPDDAVPDGVTQRPWTWRDLCGWYSFGPGVLTDPQPRMLGNGAEVVARRDHLALRGLVPVPAVRRGLRLHPVRDDPDAFRVRLPGFGSGTTPVVFSRGPGGEVTALHLGAQMLSLEKRPDTRNPRLWVDRGLVAGAAALAVGRLLRSRNR